MRVGLLTPWPKSAPSPGRISNHDVYALIPLVYASHPMRIAQVFLVAIVTAVSVFAQDPKPLAERLAAQNALFDEQYESDLRNFPERATAFGDYRYNDQLNDYSLDAIQRRHETDEAFLKRIEAIPTTGFSDQDQLSHDLLTLKDILESTASNCGNTR